MIKGEHRGPVPLPGRETALPSCCRVSELEGAWERGHLLRMSEEREVQRGMGPDQGHAVGTRLSGDRDQGSDCPDEGFSPEAWNLSDSQHSSSRCFCLLTQCREGAWAPGQHNGWMAPAWGQAQARAIFLSYMISATLEPGASSPPTLPPSDNDPCVHKDLLMTISNILLPNNYNSSWAIYTYTYLPPPPPPNNTRAHAQLRMAWGVHYRPQHCALACPPKHGLPWTLI